MFILSEKFHLGLDIGSTTVKLVIINSEDKIIYSDYKRHFSDIRGAVIKLINNGVQLIKEEDVTIAVTGSGGLFASKFMEIPFVQEVTAATEAIEKYIDSPDVSIELGGEDAKITFFGENLEQRMNGSCAGGTGAFIDQMASLLGVDAKGLNELSKNHERIYPIAARCGVFAKTDIQPLINEGAEKSDIAASIFQAVVNQTIGGLACGKKIKGNVVFLGGPLCFLSELRNRFIETLKLKESEVIFPLNSNLYVAIGAALLSKNSKEIKCKKIIEKLSQLNNREENEINKLRPLFESKEELIEFKKRHDKLTANRKNIKEYKGEAFLGIDAGSTTTKAVLISDKGEILYSYYDGNKGNPLKETIKILKDMYLNLNENIVIAKACVVGYGEAMLKEAFKVDIGEVETIAHYKAAKYFTHNVDFILDIGGQDIKCITIKNGAIDSIMLNEACSSGCGSFLENYANSMNLNINEFSALALNSKKPVDLGSRCTVFMNSRVKQAQKEGATPEDISAGLSYSIIKNALFKVIKIKDFNKIGENIVIQGGTFYNDSVVRTFEILTNKQVIRPDIAGLMGAFGAAIIAKENSIVGEKTKLISLNRLKEFKVKKENSVCLKCENNCKLNINIFNEGNKFTSGNRCEKGSGNENHSLDENINMYKYKMKRIFDYIPLDKDEKIRGTIGIPRVLNIYEDYPFWATFFKKLKFRVELSPFSTQKIYEMGMETIPSESLCYPGKLIHGHIMWLLNKKVDYIFYPCIPNGFKEEKQGEYNCPIVISYPEVIKNNFDFNNNKTEFLNPFLPMDNKEKLKNRLCEEFSRFNISKEEVEIAVEAAFKEREAVKADIRKKGEDIINFLNKTGKRGIVLLARPYHIDPGINHGIPELINSFGLAILTEDSVAHLGHIDEPLRVIDQWSYYSTIYKAASFVSKNKNLEIIEINSFGCGLDSVAIDQVEEILSKYSRIFTVLKIDEGTNLGAIKIRIRSLLAVIADRQRMEFENKKIHNSFERVEFTKKMKENHTILAPELSPIHFQFIEKAFKSSGYNLEVLPIKDKNIIDEGLRYVNNDTCFPAIIIVGQIIEAINSGKYDKNKLSILMFQTCGGCKASNYVALLRKALIEAELGFVPVIAMNFKGMEKNSGFKISIMLVHKMIIAIIYGDLLMKLLHKTRPYEVVIGSTEKLYERWVEICKSDVEKNIIKNFKRNVNNIIKEFEDIEIIDEEKIKIGIVGEIFTKYHPLSNNNLIKNLELEGVEVVLPEFLDFFLYCVYDGGFNNRVLNGKKSNKFLGILATEILELYRKPVREALSGSKIFSNNLYIWELFEGIEEILSIGNQTGEGWLLTAKIQNMIRCGITDILCVQPFGCLPNHITGRGMIKELLKRNKGASIVALDYDSGASEVNQINRIKLMLSNANKKRIIKTI